VRAEDIGEPAPPGGWLQPLKVVVDPRLSTPPDARLLSSPGRTLIATTCEEDDVRELLAAAGAEVIVFPGTADRVSLEAVLSYLAEVEVNEVLLETGATLSGSMLRAGLVDEMVFYMAPVLMGDRARGLFQLPDLDQMADRLELDILDVRAVGRDWRLTARPRIKPAPAGP
jgi:diaminohydroxyphosphoribosylaminopyrimidine deaminase/5-amino-6-(5-phosphoribosylamino)uracil reductase